MEFASFIATKFPFTCVVYVVSSGRGLSGGDPKNANETESTSMARYHHLPPLGPLVAYVPGSYYDCCFDDTTKGKWGNNLG